MTVGALNNGFTAEHPARLLVGLPGRQPARSRTTSPRPTGYIDFAKALQLSCDTFFYRVGYHFWQKFGTDPTNVNAKDPLVERGQGLRLRPADRHRPAGRGHRPDRRPALEARLLEGDEGLLLQDRPQAAAGQDERLPARLRPRVLPRGQLLPGRRRGELRDRPGRHDGHAAAARPRLRRARPTAARSTSRGSAKAIVDPDGKVVKRITPKVAGPRRRSQASDLRYVDNALLGTAKVGTLAWKFVGFPLDKVQIRGKTGSAEVYGKQSTSWVATYDEELRRGDDGQPGRHRLGHLRPGRAQDLGVALRHPRQQVTPSRAAIPGTTPPDGAPVVHAATARSCRPPEGLHGAHRHGHADALARRPDDHRPALRRPASTGC